MNHRRVMVLLLALAGVACRTRPYPQPEAPPDLASRPDLAAPVDLSRAPDLATVPDLAGACAALARCVHSCTPDVNFCELNCHKNASDRANTLYQLAVECGDQWCLGSMPGAPRRCAGYGNASVCNGPCDAPGVPPGDCRVCGSNILSKLLGTACMPPDDSACTTTACDAPIQACLQD